MKFRPNAKLLLLIQTFRFRTVYLLPACLLEGRVDMVGSRSFRTVHCDIPLPLINVMFLSTLLVSSPLSHSKGLCFPNCHRVLFLNEDTSQTDVCKIFPVCIFAFLIQLDLCSRKLKHSETAELLVLYFFFCQLLFVRESILKSYTFFPETSKSKIIINCLEPGQISLL